MRCADGVARPNTDALCVEAQRERTTTFIGAIAASA